MYFRAIFSATALCATLASADFMVYTEPPIPTSLIPSFTNRADVHLTLHILLPFH